MCKDSNMVNRWRITILAITSVKSARIRSFSGPYFPAFGLNTEKYGDTFSPSTRKYGPENLRIPTLFTQCRFQSLCVC